MLVVPSVMVMLMLVTVPPSAGTMTSRTPRYWVKRRVRESEREKERDRERQRVRERERQRKTETEREGERKKEKERQRETPTETVITASEKLSQIPATMPTCLTSR